MVEERRVVLDADFIMEIGRYQSGDSVELFRRMFCVMDKIPVIHPYVADNELDQNAFAKKLIEQGDLTVIAYGEFLPADPEEEEIYRQNFEDMYTMIRDRQASRGQGIMLPLDPGEDIFKRHARRSFGEIHSILMATELGIPLFYSNDGGAKTVARHFTKGSLIVENTEEVVKKILETDNSALNRRQRRFLENYRNRYQQSIHNDDDK